MASKSPKPTLALIPAFLASEAADYASIPADGMSVDGEGVVTCAHVMYFARTDERRVFDDQNIRAHVMVPRTCKHNHFWLLNCFFSFR